MVAMSSGTGNVDHDPMATARWLMAFGLIYSLAHHQGFVLKGLGSLGATGTTWADWIDLATPYLVLTPAAIALVLAETGVGKRTWALFATGAVLYTQGHGIHLAANSVSNLMAADASRPSTALLDVVHLWDELVGHYLWYGGLSLVLLAVTSAFRRHRWATTPVRATGVVLLAVAVGLTYATNALEGHFAWPGLAFAGAMVAWLSVDRRTARSETGTGTGRPVADLVLLSFATTVLVLGFYGCWHRGFPEPSSVGWNLLAR